MLADIGDDLLAARIGRFGGIGLHGVADFGDDEPQSALAAFIERMLADAGGALRIQRYAAALGEQREPADYVRIDAALHGRGGEAARQYVVDFIER